MENSRLSKNYYWIYFLQLLEAITLVIADILFFKYNAPGIARLTLILIISQPLIGFLAILLGYYAIGNIIRLARNQPELQLFPHSKIQKIRQSPIWILVNFVAAIGIVFLFLNLVLLNYYQPLSLYDIVIMFTALSWGTFAITLVGSSILFGIKLLIAKYKEKKDEKTSNQKSQSIQPKISEGIIIALLLWCLFFPTYLAIDQLNQPEFNTGLIQNQDLFSRGGDDYYTFRIPSMIVIPQGSTLNNSELVAADIILTFAEGRQNAALDSGAIDTVMRRSIDAGENWEVMEVINRWPTPAEEIKFGNPTAVFDNITGQVFLTYTNMSHLNELKYTFYRVSNDGGASWTSPVKLNCTDRTVLGPGHGIQMTVGSHAGRLIIPAYNRTGSYIIFSDDHGETWNYGGNVGYGNEHEVLELENGTLYMSLRTKVGVSSVHEDFDRLYSMSSDGGLTWTTEKMHSYLPDPIVMGSTARLSSNTTSDRSRILTSLPGSYTSRVKMTIYMSYDESQTWTEEKILYFGPSGYSEIAVLTNGDIFCLFERGRTEYSDILTFVQVDLAWLISD
jgi:hypothetical protein